MAALVQAIYKALFYKPLSDYDVLIFAEIFRIISWSPKQVHV